MVLFTTVSSEPRLRSLLVASEHIISYMIITQHPSSLLAASAFFCVIMTVFRVEHKTQTWPVMSFCITPSTPQSAIHTKWIGSRMIMWLNQSRWNVMIFLWLVGKEHYCSFPLNLKLTKHERGQVCCNHLVTVRSLRSPWDVLVRGSHPSWGQWFYRSWPTHLT